MQIMYFFRIDFGKCSGQKIRLLLIVSFQYDAIAQRDEMLNGTGEFFCRDYFSLR